MKRLQQSYAIPIALFCVMLTGFIAVTSIDNRDAPGSRMASPVPATVVAGEMAGIAQARQAIQALTETVATQDEIVQLPVAPAPVPLPVAPASNPLASFQLTTVVQSGGRRSAIVNGQVVHVGDRLDKSTVINAIDTNAVRMTRDGQKIVLTMHSGTNDKDSTEGDTK